VPLGLGAQRLGQSLQGAVMSHVLHSLVGG
jgi:hypothetical protein